MDVPLEIAFRNMDHSDAVEARVREKVAKLEEGAGRITSCRVLIERPHHKHVKGDLFHIRIELGVPGHPELVVSHEPHDKHAHEDIYVTLRDAFDAARRQLRELAGRRQDKERRAAARPS